MQRREQRPGSIVQCVRRFGRKQRIQTRWIVLRSTDATRNGRTSVATLLLTGVALNSLLSATSSFLISLQWVRWEVAEQILFWLMGGLDSRTWTHVWLTAPIVAIGLIVGLLYSRSGPRPHHARASRLRQPSHPHAS